MGRSHEAEAPVRENWQKKRHCLLEPSTSKVRQIASTLAAAAFSFAVASAVSTPARAQASSAVSTPVVAKASSVSFFLNYDCQTYLDSHSPLRGFYYNKSIRAKGTTTAEGDCTGVRWNHFLSHGLSTPKFRYVDPFSAFFVSPSLTGCLPRNGGLYRGGYGKDGVRHTSFHLHPESAYSQTSAQSKLSSAFGPLDFTPIALPYTVDANRSSDSGFTPIQTTPSLQSLAANSKSGHGDGSSSYTVPLSDLSAASSFSHSDLPATLPSVSASNPSDCMGYADGLAAALRFLNENSAVSIFSQQPSERSDGRESVCSDSQGPRNPNPGSSPQFSAHPALFPQILPASFGQENPASASGVSDSNSENRNAFPSSGGIILPGGNVSSLEQLHHLPEGFVRPLVLIELTGASGDNTKASSGAPRVSVGYYGSEKRKTLLLKVAQAGASVPDDL